ncbi:MAG: hypothetical protein ACI306_02275 [Muribaculaceae bacterium]
MRSLRNINPVIPMAAFAAIVCVIQIISGIAPIEASDTASYFTASRNEIFCDDLRLPIYPLLLHILQMSYVRDALLGPGGIVLTVLQWAAWVFGTMGVWRVCRQYGCSNKVCCIALAMLLLPPFWLSAAVILPEVLCTVALIWLVERSTAYISKPSMAKALHIGIITLTLIMLKPVFVYLVAVMAVYWLVVLTYKHYRTTAIAGLVSIILCGGAAYTYVYAVERICNIKGVMTRAQLMNDYYMLREHNIVSADDIIDDELRELYIDAGRGAENYYQEFKKMGVWYSYLVVLDFKKAHPDALTKIRLEHFATTLSDGVLYLQFLDAEYTRYFYFPFAAVWAILLTFVVLAVRRWRARRRFPIEDYVLAAILGGGYVATLWGAMHDWGRLLVPFGFVLLVLTVVTVNRITIALRKPAQNRCPE